MKPQKPICRNISHKNWSIDLGGNSKSPEIRKQLRMPFYLNEPIFPKI